MDIETAFQASRWEILETLAYRDASATEIAKRSKLSLPNVSQQARMLEAAGILTVKKALKNGVGKPRMTYQLNKNLAKVTVLRQGFAGQRSFIPQLLERVLLSILLWETIEDHYFLLKYVTDNAVAFSQSLGVAIANSSGGELHFLVLAKEEDVEQLRKEFIHSKIVSPLTGKKKNMINWIHSPEQVQNGIGKGDEYYTKLVSKVHPLIEQGSSFRELVTK